MLSPVLDIGSLKGRKMMRKSGTWDLLTCQHDERVNP
jgi:hypothetical protein